MANQLPSKPDRAKRMNAYPRRTRPPQLDRISMSHLRAAFTLVEILVVIAIIGILAAILVPAVNGALRTAKEGAIRTEIGVLEQALEKYNQDKGDYPPDFSDWAAVERHFRKAYPNIDNNELRILSQFTHLDASQSRCAGSGTADPRTSATFDHYPHAIDRAEALVFCLGGFSRDEAHPFTGQGGPLVLRGGVTSPYTGAPTDSDFLLYQYNSERDTGDFPFDTERLSIGVFDAGTGPISAATAPYAYSNDEGVGSNDLGFFLQPDPFPAYAPGNSERPLAYFSSRTFSTAFGINFAGATPPPIPVWSTAPHEHMLNVYLPAGATGSIADTGIARPYASNIVDTTPPTTIEGFTVTGTVLQFAASGKFQIISAGLDNNYGGTIIADVGPASTGILVYPSGEAYNPFTTYTPSGAFGSLSVVNKYQDDLVLETHHGSAGVYQSNPQLDNVTNFTTRTLESDLP